MLGGAGPFATAAPAIGQAFRPSLYGPQNSVQCGWKTTVEKKPGRLENVGPRGSRNLPKKAEIWRDAGAARPQGARRRSSLCDPEARGAAAALRPAARARRRHEELGRDARPEP